VLVIKYGIPWAPTHIKMLYSLTNSIRNGGSGQGATVVLKMDLKSVVKASAMLLHSVTI
jgi:hypothetical protein